MGIFKKKSKEKQRKRPDICLSLSCETMEELEEEIAQYKGYCQLIEWCVDGFSGAADLTKEEFLIKVEAVKKLCAGKKLIVDYKGNEQAANRIVRWSMETADLVDIDADNSQLDRLVREAKRKKTKVIISHHDFEKMPSKTEIAEMFVKLERKGGDILKIACFAKEELDTYSILEGAAAYSQLSKNRPIVAIAMGEEGQVSRICAGDFGSVMTYASGSKATAPGQFNAAQLVKYMDRYYEGKA